MKLFVVSSLFYEFVREFVRAFQGGIVAQIGAAFAADTSPQTKTPADASFLGDAAEAIANVTHWIKPVDLLGQLAPVGSAATA